jgi:hypothetical protein
VVHRCFSSIWLSRTGTIRGLSVISRLLCL